MSVRSEIETRILNWANAQTPKIPVALENVPFNKPSTGGFLEVFFLGKVTVNPDVSAEKERETGLVQINVCWPIGTGAGPQDAVVQAVRGLFPVLPKTGAVSIERPPQESGGFIRDNYRKVPITVSYRRIA